jgi:hypothetical protein
MDFVTYLYNTMTSHANTMQHPKDDEPPLPSLDAQSFGLAESSKDDPFTNVLQSFLRMTTAGFGGALVGLALGRNTATARSVVQRGKPYRDAALPTSWAVACITFTGIVETTHLMAPTRRVLWAEVNPYVAKAIDMTMGGALAGAMFRGAQIRSANSPAPMVTPRIMAGLGPGLLLGLVAGVLQAGLEYVVDEVERVEEEKKRLRREEMRRQIMDAQRIARENLEAEIAALDAKELAEAEQLAREEEEAATIEAAKNRRPWWKVW